MENSRISKMVTLQSSDGVELTVPEEVAMLSPILRNMIEDVGTQNPLRIVNVNAKILEKVIEYCKLLNDATEEALKTETDMLASSVAQSNWREINPNMSDWEERFLNVDQETLFELIMAANYLHIQKLLQSACQKVADMIRGKTVHEIRETFHIINDYTPEEEEEIIRKYQWAFR
jgi:S-phase kinase-associated protein 1